MPGSRSTAWQGGQSPGKSAITSSSMRTSAFSQPVSCRSEVTFPPYGWGSRSPSSHAEP
jgi:hypothetical protein